MSTALVTLAPTALPPLVLGQGMTTQRKDLGFRGLFPVENILEGEVKEHGRPDYMKQDVIC